MIESDAIYELGILLRPAGGGLHLVSTGKEAQQALQRKLYGVEASSEAEAQIRARFEANLRRIEDAKVIVLGVPSDVGAGFRRGANLGPGALRTALLEHDPDALTQEGVVDIGDVFVVPQLLHDDMLSVMQLEASRRALYGDARAAWPVSPLSIEERVLDLVLQIAPHAKPLILGGDHSCAWPVAAALHRAGKRFAIVQPDAHTDLLEERLGVKYCFATWSFHANELIGRGGKLVQVGTRASGKTKAHWEGTLDVRQYWADTCNQDREAALASILAHVESLGVEGVYFSNDIDGTDEAFADATGTPEPRGLHPDFVDALITKLGEGPGLIAADLVEVAPSVASKSGSADITLETSVRYLTSTLRALLR